MLIEITEYGNIFKSLGSGVLKLKILAVDDEEYVLNAIKPLCLDHDLEIETLPLKAIERINKEKFDIFIIDYQMPHINGIELLETT